MRNYWLRIAFGAVAIFAVGMVGITLARQSMGRVRGVVEGSGPIALPILFVPFKLDGQKLGTLSKVVLHRDAPKRIASVELEVKVRDSAIARGLEGCRLAANFDEHRDSSGVKMTTDPLSKGVFSCLHGVDSTQHFQEFGHAILQPGNVRVPLLLPNDIVDDLKKGDFNSSSEDSVAKAQEQRDSIQEAVAASADSIAAAAEQHADSIMARTDRLVDSLRKEGRRRADSTRRVRTRMADSVARH